MAALRAEPLPLRGQQRPAVAEDMRSILGGLDGAEEAGQPRSGRLTQVRTLLEPRASGKDRRGLAAALLVGVAGVALGALLAKGSADPPPVPAPTATTATASIVEAPARTPPTPAGQSPASSLAPPTVSGDPPTPPPAAKPPVEEARALPARQPSPSRPKAPPPVAPQQPTAQAAPVQDLRAACDTLGGAEQAACLAPAVLAADRQLRHAYATAIDAGVERSIINDYRKRWSRLRNRSSDEPAYLIGSYGALAEDLYRLADETRATGRNAW